MSGRDMFRRGGGSSRTSYSDSNRTSVTGQGGFSGFSFEFRVAVTGSSMSFVAETEGAVGLSLSDALGIGDDNTARVVIGPDIERIENVVRFAQGQTQLGGIDLPDPLEDAVSNAREFDYSGTQLPSLRDIQTIPMFTRAEVRTPFGGVLTRGNDPEQNGVDIRIQRVPVPNVPAVVNAIENIPPVEITARLKPDGWLANILAEATGRGATATVEIPVEAFIEYVDLEADFGLLENCIQSVREGNDIQSALDGAEGAVDSVVSRTDRLASRFQSDLRKERNDVINEVLEEFGEAGGEVREGAEDAVEELKDELPSREEITEAIEDGTDPTEFIDNAPTRRTALARISRGEDIEGIFREAFEEVRSRAEDNVEDVDNILGNGIPRDLAKGMSRGGIAGTFTPDDVVDEDFLVREVVCEGKYISELDRGELFNFEITISEEVDTRVKDRLFRLFRDDLRVVEQAASELNDLRSLVGNAYSQGSECFLLFEDLIEDLAGCPGSQIRTDGGRGMSLYEAFYVILGKERSTGGGGGRGVSRGPIRDPGLEPLTCADIANRIRNKVNDVEERSDELRNANPFEFDFSRVERLMGEIDTVQSQIRSEVEDRNPCKSRMLARARGAGSGLEDIRDVDFDDLPCVSRFRDAEQRVSQFESLAQAPSQTIREIGEESLSEDEMRELVQGSGLDPQEVIEHSAAGEIEVRTGSLVSFLEDEVDGDCLQFFLSRVREAENEIERVTRGLSINNELFDAASERRGEILEAIRANVANPEEYDLDIEDFLGKDIEDVEDELEDLE